MQSEVDSDKVKHAIEVLQRHLSGVKSDTDASFTPHLRQLVDELSNLPKQLVKQHSEPVLSTFAQSTSRPHSPTERRAKGNRGAKRVMRSKESSLIYNLLFQKLGDDGVLPKPPAVASLVSNLPVADVAVEVPAVQKVIAKLTSEARTLFKKKYVLDDDLRKKVQAIAVGLPKLRRRSRAELKEFEQSEIALCYFAELVCYSVKEHPFHAPCFMDLAGLVLKTKGLFPFVLGAIVEHCGNIRVLEGQRPEKDISSNIFVFWVCLMVHGAWKRTSLEKYVVFNKFGLAAWLEQANLLGLTKMPQFEEYTHIVFDLGLANLRDAFPEFPFLNERYNDFSKKIIVDPSLIWPLFLRKEEYPTSLLLGTVVVMPDNSPIEYIHAKAAEVVIDKQEFAFPFFNSPLFDEQWLLNSLCNVNLELTKVSRMTYFAALYEFIVPKDYNYYVAQLITILTCMHLDCLVAFLHKSDEIMKSDNLERAIHVAQWWARVATSIPLNGVVNTYFVTPVLYFLENRECSPRISKVIWKESRTVLMKFQPTRTPKVFPAGSYFNDSLNGLQFDECASNILKELKTFSNSEDSFDVTSVVNVIGKKNDKQTTVTFAYVLIELLRCTPFLHSFLKATSDRFPLLFGIGEPVHTIDEVDFYYPVFSTLLVLGQMDVKTKFMGRRFLAALIGNVRLVGGSGLFMKVFNAFVEYGKPNIVECDGVLIALTSVYDHLQEDSKLKTILRRLCSK